MYEWIANPQFIADIYGYVKNCARILPMNLKKIEGADLCTIDISRSDVPSRFVECEPSSPDFKLSYHEEDITIYGGAALHMYDFVFAPIKPPGFGTVKDLIGTTTNDIDMVWWPRSSSETHVATARSPGIKHMCEEFKTMLYVRSSHLKRAIESTLGFKPEITIDMFDSLAYGAYTITITFAWGTHTHRVCEISIHDSASSQRSPTLQHMSEDIVHMTNDDVYPIHKILPIPYNSKLYIPVPNYLQFIQQQFFALNRLLFDPDGTMSKQEPRRAKGIILWRRMFFMNQLLKTTFYNLPFDASPLLYQIDKLTKDIVRRSGPALDAYCRDLRTRYAMDRNYAVSTLCNSARATVKVKQSRARGGKRRSHKKCRKTRKNR